MDVFNVNHAKVLYLRFCAIYDHKFTKAYHDDYFKSLWYNEWCQGLECIDPSNIKNALDYCRKNLEWPPSIAEFIKICELASGLPSINECMTLCIRREFNHPIVEMCYQHIGSWAMKHDSENELKRKFKEAYEQSLVKFRKQETKAIESQAPVKRTIPDDDDFAKFAEGEDGLQWVDTYIQQQLTLKRLPQEYLQNYQARMKGFQWVKQWIDKHGQRR